MSKSDEKDLTIKSPARNYRALAAECERQAQLAVEEPSFREMQERLARSYAALAEAEDRLNNMAAAKRTAGQSSREAA